MTFAVAATVSGRASSGSSSTSGDLSDSSKSRGLILADHGDTFDVYLRKARNPSFLPDKGVCAYGNATAEHGLLASAVAGLADALRVAGRPVEAIENAREAVNLERTLLAANPNERAPPLGRAANRRAEEHTDAEP